MLKPTNYDNLIVDDYSPIKLGGHYLEIIDVKESVSRSGNPLLVIHFDFAENDVQPGLFFKRYANDTRPEPRWPAQATFYIVPVNKKNECSLGLKKFVIAVEQYKDGDLLTLRLSLENNDFLEIFCIFCQDLLDSVKVTNDDETAYHTLRSRYYSWRQLFRSDNARLTETEIMGLIGELLFLKDYMIPERGIDVALESWMGPEKTHKDFSDQQDWFEVKTISFGKESVRISSIEQLDSDIDGTLVVYELEKMSPSFEGIKKNFALVFSSSNILTLSLAILL